MCGIIAFPFLGTSVCHQQRHGLSALCLFKEVCLKKAFVFENTTSHHFARKFPLLGKIFIWAYQHEDLLYICTKSYTIFCLWLHRRTEGMAFSFGKSQPAPAAPAMSGGFNFGNAPMFVPPPTTTGSSAGFSFGTNSSQTQTVPPAPFSFSCSSPTFTFGAGFQQPKASTVADFDPLEHIVYNDELFISKPDRMYECSICLNTLRNATICTSCGNSFCHKCIVDCITRLHKCSVCGCELKSTTEGVVPNRTTRGVIENYMVKCFSTQKSHQSGGGAFYGTFAVGLPPPIKEDDKGSKANSGVPPPPTPTPAVSPSVNDKSESVIPPTSTATPSSSSLPSSSSSSSSSSPSSSFPSSSLPAEMCTEMCDWTGHLRDAESHYRHDCPFALVQCTFEGCSHISPRRDLSAHLSQCPFRKTSCQWCKKGNAWLYPYLLCILLLITHTIWLITQHIDYTRHYFTILIIITLTLTYPCPYINSVCVPLCAVPRASMRATNGRMSQWLLQRSFWWPPFEPFRCITPPSDPLTLILGNSTCSSNPTALQLHNLTYPNLILTLPYRNLTLL